MWAHEKISFHFSNIYIIPFANIFCNFSHKKRKGWLGEGEEQQTNYFQSATSVEAVRA